MKELKGTKKLTVHKDDKCPICDEKFINEKMECTKAVTEGHLVGAVHTECYMPFMHHTAVKVLVNTRVYSIGDTVATTPVVREVRRLYPKAKIVVATMYPDLFRHNPYINGMLDLRKDIPQPLIDEFQFRIDAFNTDELGHYAMHSVEHSFNSAFSRSVYPNDMHYDLYYSPEDREFAIQVAKENGIDPEKDKCILIHPHKTEWSTRDWGAVHFKKLAVMIQERYPDHKLVSIGGKRAESGKYEMENYIHIDGAVNLFGRLPLLSTVAFMDFPCNKLMVTPDTGTLHLAGSRPELPIVGIFTLIKQYFRTPMRRGRLGYKFLGVEADSGCNCTYDARLLTESSGFRSCPKFSLFDRALKAPIPKKLKANIYRNYSGKEVENPNEVGKLIRSMRDQFKGPDLPCFPAPEKVMKAVERMLNEHG